MRWFRKPVGDPLTVSMTGLKLGDRLLFLGSSDTALAAALAGKVGLTGRACLVDEPPDRVTAAAAVVEQEGALVESFAAPLTALPFEASSFDVVVARNVFPAVASSARGGVVAEVNRVVRAGGRCIVIDDVPRGALGGLIGGRSGDESPGASHGRLAGSRRLPGRPDAGGARRLCFRRGGEGGRRGREVSQETDTAVLSGAHPRRGDSHRFWRCRPKLRSELPPPRGKCFAPGLGTSHVIHALCRAGGVHHPGDCPRRGGLDG